MGKDGLPRGTTPVDYARKHWSGLVKDYYAARIDLYVAQALADAKAGRVFDKVRRVVMISYYPPFCVLVHCVSECFGTTNV